MPGSSQLSVTTVVALVLGGVAAVVLAGAVAGKEASRVRNAGPRPSAPATTQAPRGSSAPPTAEIEVPAELLYPVEASTPSDAPP